MKKIMALSMAAIMAFTVAGCGSNKPAETTAAGTAAAETAAESDTTAADTAAEGKPAGLPPVKSTSSTQTLPLPPLSLKMKRERW